MTADRQKACAAEKQQKIAERELKITKQNVMQRQRSQELKYRQMQEDHVMHMDNMAKYFDDELCTTLASHEKKLKQENEKKTNYLREQARRVEEQRRAEEWRYAEERRKIQAEIEADRKWKREMEEIARARREREEKQEKEKRERIRRQQAEERAKLQAQRNEEVRLYNQQMRIRNNGSWCVIQ